MHLYAGRCCVRARRDGGTGTGRLCWVRESVTGCRERARARRRLVGTHPLKGGERFSEPRPKSREDPHGLWVASQTRVGSVPVRPSGLSPWPTPAATLDSVVEQCHRAVRREWSVIGSAEAMEMPPIRVERAGVERFAAGRGRRVCRRVDEWRCPVFEPAYPPPRP